MLVHPSDGRPETAIRNVCPGCGGQMEPFFEFPNVPVNSCILMETREEALSYPRGDVVLGFCSDCGFICNLAFDQKLAEYSSRYEETQGFSPTFREFHRKLALALLERYDIHDKDVLEIGCGKGEFLALLCELGPNRGVGFDPSYDDERGILDSVTGARVIADFYSEAYADSQADLVCCKMTMEHIPETAEFAKLARRAMRPGSVLYFLVPEAMRIVRDCAFEDIYYEHCSYFTAGSLARVFRAQGFDVLRLGTEYAGQYLSIEAALADGPTAASLPEEQDLDELRKLVASFNERCTRKIDSWRQRLEEARGRGGVVLWGSGSKAVSFLNAVDAQGAVERVTDINPHKHGHFMPGTAQPIVSPESLAGEPPGTVIIMNPVYRSEIAGQLGNMGLEPELLTL